jgi:uncharacterized membrane protein YoaK (UPF0700 family)
VAKLLALPVFCVVVAMVRMLGLALGSHNVPRLRIMLGLKLLLLVAGAMLAVRLGPFPNGDTWPALVTGMTLVSAMAIQNAVQRVHLGASPPTTLMTGNTTQVVLDVVDLLRHAPEGTAARRRLPRMASNIAAFAVGCGAAAALFASLGVWCFAAPPLIALVALLARSEAPARAVG